MNDAALSSRATSAPPSRSLARARLALLPYMALAAVVVAADQATKALVRARLAEGEAWPSDDAWLAISHVENSGAAFGMFQGAGNWLLLVTALGAAATLVYLLLYPRAQALFVAALSLVLAGAMGNLIDRVSKGSVTDFIDPTHYPAFNIADSAIVVGVAALAWLSLRPERDEA